MSEHGDQPIDRLLPCTRCSTPTPHGTMAMFGARCHLCYLAFCRQQQPRVLVGDKRQGNREWAHALKARDDGGEHIAPAVRDMYRAALGLTGTRATPPINSD